MEHEFREKKIPSLKTKRNKIGVFRNFPINFSHDLANEGYIDFKEAGLSGDNHYFNLNNSPYYHSIDGAINKLFLRKSVVEKLININNRLEKKGLELYFYDCYRPIKVQQFLYNNWLPQYLKRVKPHFSDEELSKERDNYSAKPPISEDQIDRNSPPPHTTGGAMDVTLRFINTKNLLFMGTIYDDTTKFAHTDYFESRFSKRILTLSEEEALKNRRILFHSMKEEGIENYPFEWWHYSWGDQMWAMLSGNKEAFYSNLIF